MSDADKSRVSLAETTKEYQAGRDAEASARRSLNSLSVTHRLMSALVKYPGHKAGHDLMVESARTLLNSSNATTEALVKELNLDVFPWARHTIMRIVSGAVADQWEATAQVDGKPSADMSAFLPAWKEIARHNLPENIYQDPAPDNAAALRIAMLDAMQPVLKEILAFDMFHEPSQASSHAKNLILRSSQRALGDLVVEPMTDRSKSLMMQSLLRVAGSIYSSCWRNYAVEVHAEMIAMTPRQQREFLEKNNGLIPLDKVDLAFSDSYSKQIEMVQYLSAVKSPTVEHSPPDVNDHLVDFIADAVNKPEEVVHLSLPPAKENI